MAPGKDSRFTGEVFQEFRTARNVVLQTVIPGHHQSLGATERGRGLFRSLIDHLVGGKKPNSPSRKEWGEFSAMTMMRLNAQVRQFGGFAPGQRVFGRKTEIPIGALRNPHFCGFYEPERGTYLENSPVIRCASEYTTSIDKCRSDEQLNMALRRRGREAEMVRSFYAKRFSSYRQIGRINVENGCFHG